jgi:hypothetical protein
MKHLTQEELDGLKLGDVVEIKTGSGWLPAIVVPSYYDKFVQFFTIHKVGQRKAPEILSEAYHHYWWDSHCYAIGVARPDLIRHTSRIFKKNYRAGS